MSTEFDADALRHLARLARLDLTPDELATFSRQLSDILAYAEQVREINTAGIPATSHPTGTAGVLRPDAPMESLPRDEVLSQAPDADVAAGLFKVPRVLGS
jgi:aspartyl-tRNA(Asn)/glutamyl-tRNA(Gln) amidotransferase subunit C